MSPRYHPDKGSYYIILYYIILYYIMLYYIILYYIILYYIILYYITIGQIAGTPPALIMKIYARTKKKRFWDCEGRAIVIVIL